MDAKKVVAVVETYEKRLCEKGIPKMRMDPMRTFASLTKEEMLAHAHFQCDEVKKYTQEGWDKWGKTNRHFSVIQMCLSFAGWYTLEDLMNHNWLDIKEPEQNPRYQGGWHFVAPGRELHLCVLKVLKRQQGRPIFLDEFLEEEDILFCYTPNHFMRLCNPPNIRRARQAVRDAIGYLRRKGHIIESTRNLGGRIAYTWYGK